MALSVLVYGGEEAAAVDEAAKGFDDEISRDREAPGRCVTARLKYADPIAQLTHFYRNRCSPWPRLADPDLSTL